MKGIFFSVEWASGVYLRRSSGFIFLRKMFSFHFSILIGLVIFLKSSKKVPLHLFQKQQTFNFENKLDLGFWKAFPHAPNFFPQGIFHLDVFQMMLLNYFQCFSVAIHEIAIQIKLPIFQGYVTIWISSKRRFLQGWWILGLNVLFGCQMTILQGTFLVCEKKMASFFCTVILLLKRG